MTATEVTKVYIADGFAEDCAILLRRYLNTESLNYQSFCQVWKEMKFAYVFQGRVSASEVAELSEEVIYIAKKILTNKNNSVEESIGGLFLIYSLVNLQPFKEFAQIRLVPEDVQCIRDLELFSREHRRLDVLYILGSLLIAGPLQFHIAEREYGLERCIRKSFKEPTSVERLSVTKGVLYAEEQLQELLRAEASVSRRYNSAKLHIHGKDEPDRSLSYADEHLANELAASLRKITDYHELKADVPEEEPESEPRARQRVTAAIKEKAMRCTVNQMRHLVTVAAADRTNSEETPESTPVENTAPVINSRKKKKTKNDTFLEGVDFIHSNVPNSPEATTIMDITSLPEIDSDALTTVPVQFEYIDNSEPKKNGAKPDFDDKKQILTYRNIAGLRKFDSTHACERDKSLGPSRKEKRKKKMSHYQKSTLSRLGILALASSEDVSLYEKKRSSGGGEPS